jgi:homoserine kinase type II
MKKVFLVLHEYENADFGAEGKLIGVYTSTAKADEAIQRLVAKPGFADFPDNFLRYEFEIESDSESDAPDSGFVVQHQYEDDNAIEHATLIGVYASESEAESAVDQSRFQPEFEAYPDGFYIDRYPLDKDHWTSGFS